MTLMNHNGAADAFLAEANRIYAGINNASLRLIDDGDLTVPGFQAFEVEGQVAVRGWARGDIIVMARKLNFGPVLDALGFADPAILSTPDELVRRLVWLFGPPYRQILGLKLGQLGAPDEFDLTPQFDRYKDGTSVLMFSLLEPAEKGYPACVFQVRISHSPDRGYRAVTEQLAPQS